jgi:carboxymethylenebutenolidase
MSLGIGDWGLGIGDWGLGQSPIPNPQGIPDQTYFPVENIKIPVLAHFGEKDQAIGFSDIESAKKLESKALSAGVKFTLRIWEGADHAFMNVDSPRYDQCTSEKAFAETIEYFRKNL